MSWFVDILSYEDDTRIRRLGPFPSMHLADKADDGVNRNLNHEMFYTEIVNGDDTESEETS